MARVRRIVSGRSRSCTARIGQLIVERDFLAKRSGRSAPRTAARSLIEITAGCRSAASASCWVLRDAAFTGALASAGVRISMDGRGRWMDNLFIERLWRSLKHEDIYLKGYADGREAHAGIAAWFTSFSTNPASLA